MHHPHVKSLEKAAKSCQMLLPFKYREEKGGSVFSEFELVIKQNV